MARYSIEDTTLTNIANAIRQKTGGTDPIEVANMAQDISSISSSVETEVDPTVPSWAKQSSKPRYNANEVGAVAYTAGQNLTDAQKAQARANIAALGKSDISLGIASDGLIYVFINGQPVGTGIPQGQSGDVFGYVDENNTIVLNGNLADGTYTVKYEMEDGSKINIGNLVLDTNVYYSVINTLTNCTSSNSAKQAVEGESYSTTITANSGYELSSIKVTMGGKDISSTAVSGGKITIASVTGNIVITAVAEKANTNLVTSSIDASGNVYNGIGYKNGYYASGTGAFIDSSDSECVSTGAIQNILTSTSATMYVKGVTLDTSKSHCRLNIMNNLTDLPKGSIYTAANWTKYFTIETLATNYYKITPKAAFVENEYTSCVYFRATFIGTGENFIISKEPIA